MINVSIYEVHMINHIVLATLNQDDKGEIFTAFNETCENNKTGDKVSTTHITIGEELLAAHQCNGLALQHLWLKKNAIMMVMRNIDLANGLANGILHFVFIVFLCKVLA